MPKFPPSSNILRSMSGWAAVSVVLTFVTWIMVLAWWWATQRIVTTADTVLYLAGPPVIAILSVGLLSSLRNRHKKVTLTNHYSPAPGTENHEANQVEKMSRLPIVDVWAITSLGRTPDELVECLAQRRARPVPDSVLTDDEGYPLLSARVPDIDLAPVKQRLSEYLNALPGEAMQDANEWRDTVIRSLTLLDLLLHQIQQSWPLSNNQVEQGYSEISFHMLRGSPSMPLAAAKQMNLHVKLFISADWEVHEQQFIEAYLSAKLATFPASDNRTCINVISGSDDAAALAHLAQFNIDFQHDAAAHALLLLACDSMLCTSITEQWQAHGGLFQADCSHGLMPGEAAFGMLCVNDKALQYHADIPACQLVSVEYGRRDVPADISAKPSYSCLSQSVANVLAAVGMEGSMIGTVVCDADHRTSRVLECIGAMMDQTPQLDAIQNRLAVSEACGHLGAATVLGLVTAGVMQAKQALHPVLIFNVGHPIDRAAALILPSADATDTATDTNTCVDSDIDHAPYSISKISI